MFKKIGKKLLYRVFQSSSMKTVRAQIMEDNRKFVIIWASVMILFWVFSLYMSTRDADYLRCRSIYAVALGVSAVALVLAAFAAPRAKWLILPAAIAVDAAFLGAGIAIALNLAPKTIVIFASVLVIPVLFISDILSTVILLVINAVVFAVIGAHTMDPETYKWTLTNLIIFSFGGTVVGYFVNKARFERYAFADSAVQLAELQAKYAYYDQMTELQNRRAYSEKTEQLSRETPSYCCVIMADVNGLKAANDMYGHEAGDELIVGSAQCLRQSFAGIDTIYRLGGDEFCVILTDPAANLHQLLAKMEQTCAAWNGAYINGISLSFGFASTEEYSDIDSILKAADQRMYAFKSNYYSSTGRDRRQR